MIFRKQYRRWLEEEKIEESLKKELVELEDEKEIEDRFYKNLEFGTGGLRGKIAVGTNRMNIYTVGKATQGIANYIRGLKEKPSIVIAYDSRNMSKEFALRTASVLAANKIKVYLYKDLRPTPMLSFAVIHLKADMGVVITASHNPKEYNGYKVYGDDGGQITDQAALEIIEDMNAIDIFEGVKSISIEQAESEGFLEYIGEEVDEVYYSKVKELVINKTLVEKRAKEISIIYTPIYGSGNIPVRTVLKQLGFTQLQVVKEQELPNGSFPGIACPNPEDERVFELAIKMAKETLADIILGTDPDCDRIGVVVRDSLGEYKTLTGNQIGGLLTEYILSTKNKYGNISEKDTIIKTIVTSDLSKAICKYYNVQLIEVLTGFKYIGEKVKEFSKHKSNQFVLGFEESHGYLLGEFVRDKDAVIAAVLITEMALYYKAQGKNLNEVLEEVYKKYGYYKEELIAIEMAGNNGQKKIQAILENLRSNRISRLGNNKIVQVEDYKYSKVYNMIKNEEKTISLPSSNVLKFILEDGSWFVIRPSGTEPKMKIYFAIIGNSEEQARFKLATLKEQVLESINQLMKAIDIVMP
ncbi:MAG: phospho-sugar mutase [Cellulosilyticaceae bacterium]